jgi:hypothetical protein
VLEWKSPNSPITDTAILTITAIEAQVMLNPHTEQTLGAMAVPVPDIMDSSMSVAWKNGVFWDVTPCGSCKNRRFGGN